MIEVKNLTLRHGVKTILHAYSFQVERGTVLSILGANGVGKTTLLNALTGVLKPAEGHVSVHGRVGFVPQLFNVPFAYSALDIALMGRARHLGLFGSPGVEDYRVVRDFFALLDIEALHDQPFNALSGGQRQLVLIAQALSSDCECLILDEPCAALDYKNQDKVLSLLRHLQSGRQMTVIFTTHMPQHAVEIASHVLLMADGTRYKAGPVEAVLTAQNLSGLYGLPIGRAEFADHPRHTFAPLFQPGS